MPTDAPVWTFSTDNSDALRGQGLAGEQVWWMVRNGALELRGSKGTALVDGVLQLHNAEGVQLIISAADISRMLVGFTDRRGLRYQTLIWHAGADQPLRVPPNRDDWTAYTPAMRALAAMVVDRGGLNRIETGSSRFNALFVPLLMALLPLAGLWASFYELMDGWWASVLALLVAPAILIAWLWKTSPHWPHRIRSLADLDALLPHVPSGTAANIYIVARPFKVSNHKSLRALGLAGDCVWVMPHEGMLELRGDKGSVARGEVLDLHADGGTLRIPAAEVTRLRAGYFDTRYSGRHYQAFIWCTGRANPLRLLPDRDTAWAYTQSMQGFAASVARQRGLSSVELGESRFSAMLPPLLLAIPLAASVVLALFVLTNEPWWGRLIVVLVPALIFGVVLWFCIRKTWPRPIRDLAELDAYLPPLPR